MRLRRALKLLQGNQYSCQIEKFRFYMMVSGEITNFKEPSGCVGLRFLNNKKCIKLDIVLGKEVWQGKEQRKVRKHMANIFLESFEMAIAKIKGAKIDIKGDELIKDVKSIVLSRFLK